MAHKRQRDNALPKALRTYLKTTLPGKTGSRGVMFVWADLDSPSSVFEIDRKNTNILVSRRLRKSFPPGSGKELTLLKTCLFFLLQEDLLSRRISSAQEKRLSVLNASLAKILFAPN